MLGDASDLLQLPGAQAVSSHQDGRTNHTVDQVRRLKSWFDSHHDNPYPKRSEKQDLASTTGMQVKQVEGWFTNHRKRHWEMTPKPETGQAASRA